MSSKSPIHPAAEQADLRYTLQLICGKYKPALLCTIADLGTARTNQLRRCLGQISFKTLCATLKELESDGLLLRREYAEIPARVEYSLTEKGKSLLPLLYAMSNWGHTHRSTLDAAQ